jgi:hypothetical protein
VYLSQLARMIVQDADGVIIADTVINGDSDTTISSTSTAFTAATVKAALDTALSKFGGQDFQYVPSGSWVGMSPKSWMNGVVRNVMAYGSVGATTINDGVTPADTAIAAAIADVAAAGGGTVYFPPGGYLCNSPITNSAAGVSLRGAGRGVTTIQFTSATGNGIAWTAGSFSFEDFTIAHTATSTGSGIKLTGCTRWRIVGVDQFNFFGKALEIIGASGLGLVQHSSMYGTANAADRGILIGGTSSVINIIGGGAMGGDADIEIASSAVYVTITDGVAFNGSVGVKISTTTARVVVADCPGMAAVTPFTLSATPAYFYQSGNGISVNTILVAIGATSAAPDWAKGWNQIISANSGGAGTVTVPAPTPATAYDDARLTIQFNNASGGAVTWSLNAAYKVSAAIPTTDVHTIEVVFRWDSASSKWREVSRADTAT